MIAITKHHRKRYQWRGFMNGNAGDDHQYILTIVILIMTILTITKEYEYKHKIDPIPVGNEQDANRKAL